MNANLYREIAEKSKVELRPASESQLRQLIELGVPEEAILFYREAEPARCAEIAKIRLWPIKHVIEENTDYVPGCYVRPHGYVVFSTTIYGDTYCFDLNSTNSTTSAPIVLLSHEIFDETTTKGEVSKVAKRIAPDLAAFLHLFAAGELEMSPDYPDPAF
jgi:SMI1/KNR4 family protein SUKH-1